MNAEAPNQKRQLVIIGRLSEETCLSLARSARFHKERISKIMHGFETGVFAVPSTLKMNRSKDHAEEIQLLLFSHETHLWRADAAQNEEQKWQHFEALLMQLTKEAKPQLAADIMEALLERSNEIERAKPRQSAPGPEVQVVTKAVKTNLLAEIDKLFRPLGLGQKKPDNGNNGNGGASDKEK